MNTIYYDVVSSSKRSWLHVMNNKQTEQLDNTIMLYPLVI